MNILKNDLHNLILEILQPGENSISDIKKKLYFISDEELIDALIYLSNRQVLYVDLEHHSVIINEDYINIYQFIKEYNAKEQLEKFINTQKAFTSNFAAIIKQSGAQEYISHKIENGKIKSIDGLKVIAMCANLKYHKYLYRNMQRLGIRVSVTKEDKDDE